MLLKFSFLDNRTTSVFVEGNESVNWLLEVVVSRFYVVPNKCDLLKYFRIDGIRIDNNNNNLITDIFKDGQNLIISEIGQLDIIKNEPKCLWPLAEQQCTKLTRKKIIVLDGKSLTCQELMELGSGFCSIQLSDEAIEKVKKSRKFLEENILKANKVVYGINTGFGRFANTEISKEELALLQYNLIVSTAAGVGDPLSPERTRRLLVLRINVLAKGYSGISSTVLLQLVDAFNASCLSWVPEKGTVGASGDLAPLAHLAAGLMAIGKMWHPIDGVGDSKVILKKYGLQPIVLAAKEGLSLINGTQFITALGVEALMRSEAICVQADAIACMTVESLKGTVRAYSEEIHNLRPHTGQMKVAARFRSLLHSKKLPSQISESHLNCSKVQDAYTIRCCPQVHGVVNDTLQFVRKLLETEMNSVTDNPIVLADSNDVISGGNFHGEYPAKAMDYLAIAIHEIGSISERRIERLIHPGYSGLPAFLTSNGGLNSGFMIAQCTAAALVSENKVLCHPSSIDSQTTSAGTEDHVSMGGFAARKALQIVNNVEHVIAIELLCACQAFEFHRPLLSTKPLELIHQLVRTVIDPWDKDRFLAMDIDNATTLIREQQVLKIVSDFI